MTKKKTPKKNGRPTIFDASIADEICERLCNGESLRHICLSDSMPCRATVFRWLGLEEHKSFLDQYARAKEEQAEALADDIIAIADQYDTKMDILNPDTVQRAKLRIDSRKWVASKLKPKKYGDKIQSEISGPDGGKIESNVTLDPSKLSTAALAELLNATTNKG